MSELNKRLRHRRFKLKDSAEVLFTIETPTGTQQNLIVDNVSLTGIGAWCTQNELADDGLEVGAIVPLTKITLQNREYSLGRMVVRAAEEIDGKCWLAFSCVDAKIPVDGPLSKHFANELTDAKSAMEFELSPERFSLANFVENQPAGVDLFAKVHQFHVYIKDWQKTSKFSYRNVRKPSMGHRVNLARPRKNGRTDYIVMGSNDYLGLATHPEVLEAAKQAIDDYGFGSTGSPVTTGITEVHMELCDYIAKLFNKERVVLFNSGYAANVGLISALMNPQDLVIADMYAHASIQDGMQMSRGTTRFFKHNNLEHLQKTFSDAREQYAGCLLITEGIFSMDGDSPKLDKIVNLARQHRARLMVDEAHSFGVLGPSGLGACEKFGVLNQTDLIMGTFSKIGGGIGGFVATSEEVADWLYFWARSHMFSISIPPSTAAAALKALQIFRHDRSLLENLRKNIVHFKQGLAHIGYHLHHDHDPESAVIPVVVRDEKKLDIMNKILMDAGVFVIPIVYPAVSRTNCRFRFTVTSNHSVSDLDFVLNVLETAMEKADFKFEENNSDAKKAV